MSFLLLLMLLLLLVVFLLLLLVSSFSNIPVSKIWRPVHYYSYQCLDEISSLYLQCSLMPDFWSNLKRGSATACWLGLWVQILPGAWVSVCCDCCMLSGRGLCVRPIPRPDESCQVWCVFSVIMIMRRPWPSRVWRVMDEKKIRLLLLLLPPPPPPPPPPLLLLLILVLLKKVN
jgi:hypothetical protein